MSFPAVFRRLSDVSLVTLAFLVPLALSPFSTDSAVPKETLYRVLGALSVAGFAAERFVLGRGLRLGGGIDLAALGVFVLLALVSLVRSSFHPFAVDASLHLACGAAVFVVLLDPGRSERIGRAVAAAWLVSAVIVASYGIAQAVGLDFFRWTGPGDETYRVRSTFGHHSFAAMFLGASVPLAVALFGSSDRKATRLAVAFAGLLLLAALLLTRGRAGYLGCAAGLFLVAAASRDRLGGRLASRLAALALIGFVTMLAVVPSLRLRMLEGADPESPPVAVRLLVWRDSLHVVSQHPVLGTGIGLFDVALSAAESDDTLRAVQPSRFVIGHAHLEFLEVLVELGILGLAAFSVFCAAALLRAVRRGGGRDLLAIGFAGAALAVLATNLFDVNLRSAAGAAPFYLALGLARGRSR